MILFLVLIRCRTLSLLMLKMEISKELFQMNQKKTIYQFVNQKKSKQFRKENIQGYFLGQNIDSLSRFTPSHPFRYVHYLLDSGSPYTTLIHKTLCALHDKDYFNIIHFKPNCYQIGPCAVGMQLSNPNPGLNDTPYHNVNLLGRNFFRQFKRATIKEDFQNSVFEMILQKWQCIFKNKFLKCSYPFGVSTSSNLFIYDNQMIEK